MGILDKLKQFAEANLAEQLLSESSQLDTESYAMEEIDESVLNENFDINDYTSIDAEAGDQDLISLSNAVDELIEIRQGQMSSDDIEQLHQMAESYRISIEEIDSILSNRLEEIQAAIEAGYEPLAVYRTRSLYRRCPNCGWVNYADDVYCEWCGYQLRYKAASFLLGALVAAGAKGGNPNKLHSRHVKKSVAKGRKGRQAAKTGKITKKSNTSRPAAKTKTLPKSGGSISPQKRSLMGGGAASKAGPKKSLFGGSSSAQPSTKKSLFSGASPATKPTTKKTSLFGSKTTSGGSSLGSSGSSKKGSLLGGSSKSSSSKKGGMLGGSKKSSGGIKIGGLGKRRR